jgi:hypothetical protein
VPLKKKSPRKKTASRGARAARIVWISLAVVAGLAILIAIAGSIVLHQILASGKIKEWVNKEPEKLRIEYVSASAWNPWAVRVHGLELRSRDPNIEFWFRIEDARFSFAPLQILARRFHVGRLTGTGLVYRLRIRSDPGKTEAAHFAALPPIPGFPQRPLPPGEPIPGDPRTDPQAKEERGEKKDRPFTIEIDDLRLDAVREVWIELYRHNGGTGTLAGSFSLAPHRRAQVGPVRLALSGGELTMGKHTLLRPASFETSATIQQFDPRLVRGNAVWPFISGNLRVDGPLAGLGFLNYFIVADPRLEGGAGTGRASIDIDKGHGKGTVSLTSRAVSAVYKKANLHGNAAVRMRISDWDFEHNAIAFGGSRIELTDIDASEPGPDSRSWSGRFDLKTAQLKSRATPPLETEVFAHCRDARPLFTLFNVGLPGWVRGLLKLEGFDAHARVGLGPKYTRIQGLEGTGGAFRIRGRYLARQGEADGAFLIESGALSVGVGIERGKTALKLGGAEKWYEAQAASR